MLNYKNDFELTEFFKKIYIFSKCKKIILQNQQISTEFRSSFKGVNNFYIPNVTQYKPFNAYKKLHFQYPSGANMSPFGIALKHILRVCPTIRKGHRVVYAQMGISKNVCFNASSQDVQNKLHPFVKLQTCFQFNNYNLYVPLTRKCHLVT